MPSEFDVFVQLREQDAICYINDGEVYVQLSTGKPTRSLMRPVHKLCQSAAN